MAAAAPLDLGRRAPLGAVAYLRTTAQKRQRLRVNPQPVARSGRRRPTIKRSRQKAPRATLERPRGRHRRSTSHAAPAYVRTARGRTILRQPGARPPAPAPARARHHAAAGWRRAGTTGPRAGRVSVARSRTPCRTWSTPAWPSATATPSAPARRHCDSRLYGRSTFERLRRRAARDRPRSGPAGRAARSCSTPIRPSCRSTSSRAS